MSNIKNPTTLRLNDIYHHIKKRCYRPKTLYYENYGGRGIGMCDEWRYSFDNFRNWALNNGYSKELTIDRIDNNGNYCPENCRWVDWITQQNNRRNCKFITFNNETMTVSQWARKLNINSGLIYQRLKRGWSVEKSLFEPKRKVNINCEVL